MNEYIFYTAEGETTAPETCVDVDNCQVLGRAQGRTRADALKTLLKHNPWIEFAGFDPDAISVEQILTKSQWDDIAEVIDYLWQDEEHHYEKSDAEFRKGHVFNTLMRLKEMCGK